MSVRCEFCGPLNAKSVLDIDDHARSRGHLEKTAEAHGLFVNELDASEVLAENEKLRAVVEAAQRLVGRDALALPPPIAHIVALRDALDDVGEGLSDS